jgi:GAF domain-containing protein
VSSRSYQATVEQLLVDTGASRATLRLDAAGEDFPVVAEAVAHGADRIAGVRAVTEIASTPTVRHLEREREILVQDDLTHADPAVPEALVRVYGARAQMLAPLVHEGRLAGVISVHDVRGPRRWEEAEVEALRRAQTTAVAILETSTRRTLPPPDELRDAAIQAILDRLRDLLRADRCTLRQDVLRGYAFAVSHESRENGVRSLRGDFTIVQTGQPVIEQLLAERRQVVQDDSRSASDDPAFQAMLEHYGGMGAQIVTPLFAGDDLVAVVSVHYLHGPRAWATDETELAAAATELVGKLLA